MAITPDTHHISLTANLEDHTAFAAFMDDNHIVPDPDDDTTTAGLILTALMTHLARNPLPGVHVWAGSAHTTPFEA